MNEQKSPETEKSSVALVTPNDLVAPLGERMPGVTESAPAVAPPPTGPAARDAHNARDARGIKFTAERHQTDESGTPRKNARGNFVMRVDYRNAHTRNFPGNPPRAAEMPAPEFNTGQKPGDPNVSRFDEYDAAAEIYLQSAYGPVIIAFSEHARPDSEEHAALKTAVANYLRVKQIKEPSPGWSLLFVVLAVSVKKSANPAVRERAGELAAKLGLTAEKKFAAPQPETPNK